MRTDTLGWYLDQIGRYPLLNGGQEIELAKQLKSPSKRIAERARQKLYCCNLRLVVSIAKQFSNRTQSLEVLDLIQLGNLGLDKAIPRYDAERGYKFSTYASNWIGAEIRRGIANTDRLVRLPVNKHDLIISYRKIASKAGVEGVVQAMEDSGASNDLVLAALQHSSRPASLDAVYGDDGSPMIELIESRISSTESLNPQSTALSDAIGILSDNERIVVERYYGLGDNAPISMSEISRNLGISRSRIGQIHARALRRLQFCMKAK